MTEHENDDDTIDTGAIPIPIGLINPAAASNTTMSLVNYSNAAAQAGEDAQASVGDQRVGRYKANTNVPLSVPVNTPLYILTGPVYPVPATAFTYRGDAKIGSTVSATFQTTQIQGYLQVAEFIPTAATTYTIVLSYTSGSGQSYSGTISVTAT